MIGMVLVTHGQLAREFRSALEHVVGPQGQLETVTIGPDDDMESRRKDIMAAVRSVNSGEGVVVLTDMFGGTPSNLGITFLEEDKVEIVTGVNLPMLIKAASLKDAASLIDVARSLREHGKNAIWVASDLLTGATDSDQPAAPASATSSASSEEK